ncbi:MAG: acyl-CoA dehydrogenase family protein [Syntrophales bacterium]|nr:acyl-CoA dehydrogenase family protein [Syntrophales bacterium]
MPFEVTHEQEIARKIAQEFAEREIIPYRDRLREEDEDFLQQLNKKEAEAGFHLALVPRQEGGTGLGYVGNAIVTEELFAAYPIMYASMCRGFAYVFAKATGGEVKEKWMPRFLKGEAQASPFINEAQGGSDVLNYTTTARKEGDHWVINGRKCFIGAGHRADFGMVLAKTGDPKDPATRGIRSLSAFIVEKDMPGYKVERVEESMAGRDSASIRFDNVRVPESYLVPPGVGHGLTPVFMAVWDVGRLGISAGLTGCILGCCRCSVRFAKERVLFGKPIYNLQAIRHRIAEMYVDLAAARSLTYRCAWLRDKGLGSRLEQSAAKYFATQAAVRASLHAVHIHGGAGDMVEYMPQAYYRMAPLLIAAGGTDEIMKDTVGEAAVSGANPVMGARGAEESGFYIM